jgi:ribosome biogenesis GTPase A
MGHLISEKHNQLKSELNEAVKQLHDLTIRVGQEELIKLMGEVRSRVSDPFMFVIVGEVKVGKSSFINALLETDEDICAVAPHPMTDVIHQIVYGENHTENSINPYLKKITHSAEILKDIAIVDTPGTNTIVDHHQEITENFVPSSDLIVFVFEAKNPYRQSAWEFFNFIQSDWHKKIIFILQQKDLMSKEDLEINEKGVRDLAVEKGIKNPIVFSVSAKLEQEGNYSDSGFQFLRKHINENITGGQAPFLKLLSQVSTCHQINTRLNDGLNDRKQQLESDKSFRVDISDTLNDHERTSKNQVQILSENLLASYDKITFEVKEELSKGLGFFSVLKKSFLSIFDKEQAAKPWLESLSVQLEASLNSAMRKRLQAGVRDISDSLQQMAQIIGLKIQQSETILKNDHDIFSNIAERRARVLADLHDAFSKFLNDSENFYPSDILASDQRMAPNVATGTGVAVLGAILTALTNGMVFDITGGILTAVGLIFAGASLGFSKRKILKRYAEEIRSGRVRLENEITDRLNAYIGLIKSKIDSNFNKFDLHLEKEERDMSELLSVHHDIETALKELENGINKEYGDKSD